MRKRSSASRVTVKSHSIPPLVQHRRVRDAPTARATSLSHSRWRNAAAPAPAHLDLGEGRLVEQRRRLPAREVLGPDGGRPEPARPPTRPKRLVAVGRVRLEPVGALPARLLAARRPELLQPRVRRGEAQRPAGQSLLARVLHVVVGRVDLGRSAPACTRGCVVATEPPRVHLPHVERRHALDDPLGDELPHARPHPRARARRIPAATQKPRTSLGPRMNSPSGVNASGPLISRTTSVSARLGTRTSAFSMSASKRGPVLRQQLAVEVRWDAVEPPGRRFRSYPPALARPTRRGSRRATMGLAWSAGPGERPRDLRDQVLVRHRDDRDVHARQPPDLAGEHAPCVDDDLGLDRTLVRLDAGHPAPLDLDPGDARLRCRSPRRRVSRPPRAQMSAGWDRCSRPSAGTRRRERRRWTSAGTAPAPRAARSGRAGGRTSSPSRPVAPAPPSAPGTRPGGAIRPRATGGQPDLVARASGRGRRSASSSWSARATRGAGRRARRVEGRSAGQLGPLDQHHFAPAQPGQPVANAAAAHAAADDNNTRARPHRANL